MKSVLIFLSLGVLLVGSFLLLGFCSPVEYTSEISKEFKCDKSKLWNMITNLDNYPATHSEIVSIESMGADGIKWLEYDKMGSAKELEIIEKIEGEKFVVKVTDKELGLEKIRVYSLLGDNQRSVLTVTEQSVVEKLFLRSTLAISGRDHSVKKEIQNLYRSLSL